MILFCLYFETFCYFIQGIIYHYSLVILNYVGGKAEMIRGRKNDGIT